MKKPFHITLKESRKALGLSQIKCAQLLEVPFRTYWDWERGISEPALITQEGALRRLAEVKP